MQSNQDIHISFDSDQLWMLNLALAFVMFGIALDIRIADFRQLKAIPKAVIGGVFSQFIALPALTFILIIAIQLSPAFALGMILVAACPGGNVSNFMTHLAGGNSALSVSLTAIATLLAVVMTPFNLGFWGGLYEPTAGLLRTVQIDLWEMSQLVGLLLVVPLFLGMGLGMWKPLTAKLLSRYFKSGSLILFLGLILLALWKDRTSLTLYVGSVFGIVLIHNILALLTGYTVARLFRLPLTETKTLTLETGIQNSGLGLLLIFSFFDGLGGMALIAAFWGIWHLVSGLILAGLWSNAVSGNSRGSLLFYNIVKPIIRFALFCYYKEVRLTGAENIPKNKPVMLLPNHQNGLLDPLILAGYIPGFRPYFLTRSDVFRNPVLRSLFGLFRMLPIYRIRDGRNSLDKNQAIFDRCANLLAAGEVVLLFPEANHNLKRQVRPLSKGFTRIVFQTLSENPGLDLQLIPVGINYQDAAEFPDRVSFYFGTPIAAAPFFDMEDRFLATRNLIQRVSEGIQGLTTHIPVELDYDANIKKLDFNNPDYLYPQGVNRFVKDSAATLKTNPLRKSGLWYSIWDIITNLLNFPVFSLWRYGLVSEIGEIEFRSTFRFAYASIIYPFYFLVIGFVSSIWMPARIVIPGIIILFLNNLVYTKRR